MIPPATVPLLRKRHCTGDLDDLFADEDISPTGTYVAPPQSDTLDEEKSVTPALTTARSVPLIGALLIAEGLITGDQLNACLHIQAQDHPDMPIGQILVGCGYISDAALNVVLGLQSNVKLSLVETIEGHGLPPADLTALVLHAHKGCLSALLSQLGVSTIVVSNQADYTRALKTRHFDMVLVGDTFINETTTLPDQSTPFLIMPPAAPETNSPHTRSPLLHAVVSRFVTQVRIQRQQSEYLERLHQHEFEFSTIATLGRKMCAAGSSCSALTILMGICRDLFGVEAGTLYQFDHAARELIFEIVLGPHQEELYQQRLPIDRGIAGWAVRHGEPLLIPDVRRDHRFEGMFDHQSGFQTRSVLCAPLIARKTVYGVIQLINKLNGQFNERDLHLLCTLASMATLAVHLNIPSDEAEFLPITSEHG